MLRQTIFQGQLAKLTSIAQNKSMSLNNNARLLLTTVGNDLSAMNLQMEGVNMTSASGSNATTNNKHLLLFFSSFMTMRVYVLFLSNMDGI